MADGKAGASAFPKTLFLRCIGTVEGLSITMRQPLDN